jgi:NADPH-dependent ferric siderophore reductase
LWAQTCYPGDTVSGIGPRGKLLLNPDADWMVLIGDETSLPGIQAMLATTDQAVQVVVEIDDHAEWQQLGAGMRPDTQWTAHSRIFARHDGRRGAAQGWYGPRVRIRRSWTGAGLAQPTETSRGSTRQL